MTEQEFARVKELWLLIHGERAIKGAINAVDGIIVLQLPHNHPLYDSLVTAMIVQYVKAFSHNYDIGKLGADILPSNSENVLKIHNTLLGLRDKVYAHTDSHNIRTDKYGPANQVEFVYDGESMSVSLPFFDIRHENFVTYKQYFVSVLELVTAKKDLLIIYFRNTGQTPSSAGT